MSKRLWFKPGSSPKLLQFLKTSAICSLPSVIQGNEFDWKNLQESVGYSLSSLKALYRSVSGILVLSAGARAGLSVLASLRHKDLGPHTDCWKEEIWVFGVLFLEMVCSWNEEISSTKEAHSHVALQHESVSITYTEHWCQPGLFSLKFLLQ